MKKILLLGGLGQLGWTLQRSLAPLGAVTVVDQPQLNLEDSESVRDLVRQEAPQVIVNAAAYTAVDKAEGESESAMRVNGASVGVLADEARRAGAMLVHYSTDYVFDGSKVGEYVEEDEPNPLSVYGRTKLTGERAVLASGCNHLIFRTSWLYGVHGGNFAKTILRLAGERKELSIVSDQVGAPTSAALVASVTLSCLTLAVDAPARFPWGLYHVVASGYASWHEYASYIVETARELGMPLTLSPQAIRAVSSAEYGSPAKRPLNSRLATKKLTKTFGLSMPHWKADVRKLVEQLCALQSELKT